MQSSHYLQTIATIKGIFSNRCDRYGNGNQTSATFKSLFPNRCGTVRYGNGSQIVAILKGVSSKRCNIIRYDDGGQTPATLKSLFSNLCDIIIRYGARSDFRNGVRKGTPTDVTLSDYEEEHEF